MLIFSCMMMQPCCCRCCLISRCFLPLQEPTRCLGNIPPTVTAVGNTTTPQSVEGEQQLTQTLGGAKVTPGREFLSTAASVWPLPLTFLLHVPSTPACHFPAAALLLLWGISNIH